MRVMEEEWSNNEKDKYAAWILNNIKKLARCSVQVFKV